MHWVRVQAALEDAANCGSKLQHSLTKVVQRGCTTDGSIAGLKQPLSVKSCLKNTLTQSVDQDASSADKGHPQDEKPGGTLSESADSLKPVDRNSTVLLPSQLNAGQDSVRVEIASDPVAVGRPNKPDAQAVWLQGQVVRQAFSTAPPALKVNAFLLTLYISLPLRLESAVAPLRNTTEADQQIKMDAGTQHSSTVHHPSTARKRNSCHPNGREDVNPLSHSAMSCHRARRCRLRLRLC